MLRPCHAWVLNLDNLGSGGGWIWTFWVPGGTNLGWVGSILESFWRQILLWCFARVPKEPRGCFREARRELWHHFWGPIFEPNLVPKRKRRFLKTCIWCDTGFNSEGLRAPGSDQKEHQFGGVFPGNGKGGGGGGWVDAGDGKGESAPEAHLQ